MALMMPTAFLMAAPPWSHRCLGFVMKYPSKHRYLITNEDVYDFRVCGVNRYQQANRTTNIHFKLYKHIYIYIHG